MPKVPTGAVVVDVVDVVPVSDVTGIVDLTPIVVVVVLNLRRDVVVSIVPGEVCSTSSGPVVKSTDWLVFSSKMDGVVSIPVDSVGPGVTSSAIPLKKI